MSGLSRRTPLVRKPLARSAPMPRAGGSSPASRPRDTGPSPEVRQAVYEREAHRCAVCADGAGPMAVHHRAGRRMGGTSKESINYLSNLLLLCESCHLRVESHRTDALDRGLLVSQHAADPAAVPVAYRGAVVLLGNDGTVTEVGR